MRHSASSSFWYAYEELPERIQVLANQRFKMLKENPHHPSLHFKKINRYWSVRAGISYRVLAMEVDGGFLWFWIGGHDEYEKIIKH